LIKRESPSSLFKYSRAERKSHEVPKIITPEALLYYIPIASRTSGSMTFALGASVQNANLEVKARMAQPHNFHVCTFGCFAKANGKLEPVT